MFGVCINAIVGACTGNCCHLPWLHALKFLLRKDFAQILLFYSLAVHLHPPQLQEVVDFRILRDCPGSCPSNHQSSRPVSADKRLFAVLIYHKNKKVIRLALDGGLKPFLSDIPDRHSLNDKICCSGSGMWEKMLILLIFTGCCFCCSYHCLPPWMTIRQPVPLITSKCLCVNAG